MATNSQPSTTAASAVAVLCNTGYLRLYDGVQPANADTAITTQNKLAELRMNATAFVAANRVLTANAITPDTNAAATGTATWYRILESDGATVVMDGNVGTAAANLIMASVAIQLHATVTVSSLVVTFAGA